MWEKKWLATITVYSEIPWVLVSSFAYRIEIKISRAFQSVKSLPIYVPRQTEHTELTTTLNHANTCMKKAFAVYIICSEDFQDLSFTGSHVFTWTEVESCIDIVFNR